MGLPHRVPTTTWPCHTSARVSAVYDGRVVAPTASAANGNTTTVRTTETARPDTVHPARPGGAVRGSAHVRRQTHHATASAGSATRSAGSGSTRDGRMRPHAADATCAPAGNAFTHPKPRPVVTTATTATGRAGNRGKTRAHSVARSAGATTNPATSLSFPVTGPGTAALRTWSLTSSSAVAATVTGWPSQPSITAALLRSPTLLTVGAGDHERATVRSRTATRSAAGRVRSQFGRIRYTMAASQPAARITLPRTSVGWCMPRYIRDSATHSGIRKIGRAHV